MDTMRLLRSPSTFAAALAVSMAVSLSGCNPELQGICSTDADCPSGTQCIENICVNPSAGADAGKSPVCNPACKNGLVCDDGTCVNSSTSFVTIVSPTSGSEFGGVMLSVILQVNAPDTISSVQVELNTPGQTILQVNAKAGTATGSYTAVLDLTSVQVTGGDYQLVATMTHGAGKLVTSTPVSILVDKSGPVITFQPVSYPSRPAGSAAMNHFLRDETVVLTADISDALSGVSTTTPPTLTAPGIATPVVGQPVQGHVYSFTFSGREPTFNNWIGAVNVQVTATDAVGNQTQMSSTFQLSRLRWIWTKPRTQGITTAPALVGNVLVTGGSESFIYGVRRGDGSTSWELSTSSAPVGHIAAGQTNAYAAVAGGSVIGFIPTDTSLSQSARTVFTCPGASPTTALRTLVSGPAVGLTQISSSNTAQQETLFEFTEDGYLQLFRQTNFPAAAGATPGCVIEKQVTTSSNVAVVPALLPQGNTIVAFMGDVGRAVHRYSVSLGMGAGATFGFSSDWSFQGSNASEYGPGALGLPGGMTGLLFGNNSGQLYALDLNNNEIWPNPAGPIHQGVAMQASPVMDGASAYLLDQGGSMQKVALSNGTFSWSSPIMGQARSSGANAAPLVAADGTTYLPAGSAINSVNSDGSRGWTFDTATTAFSGLAVDAFSPIMACNGDIYVVGTSSAQGYIFALISDSVSGPATSGWPRSFHDNHNTANSGTPLLNASGACTD
jgi:hypothetical protein